MSLKVPFRTPGLLWKEKSPRDEEVGDGEFPDAANILAANDVVIVDFDGPQDPSIAINWEPRKKWILIMVLSSMTFITYMLSSSFGIYVQLINNKRARLSNVCAGSASTHGRIPFEEQGIGLPRGLDLHLGKRF